MFFLFHPYLGLVQPPTCNISMVFCCVESHPYLLSSPVSDIFTEGCGEVTMMDPEE